MFLLITEDGEIFQAEKHHESDPEMCDAGMLDLIDISGDKPKRYFDGEWQDIEELDYSTYQ